MQANKPGSDFASAMRQLLYERGISYRALAVRTFYSKSHLHSLATGAKRPTGQRRGVSTTRSALAALSKR